MSGPDAPLTAADESFTHQLVAPVARTAHHGAERWAERCWHLVDLGGGWVLGTGRALWRHAGRRTAVAGLNTGDVQWAVRTEEPFGVGDDPDRPDVGEVLIETVRPLREVRLQLTSSEREGFAFDLTWQARFPPVQTDPNRIERDGEVLTDYMNYYHSGWFSGRVGAGGEEREVEARAGFRDRGWGLRHHEGAARRGMHVFMGCELADEALYLLLYETSSGRRVFTNGWVVTEAGATDRVVDASHALQFHGRRLIAGTVEVQLTSGRRRRVTFRAKGRLFMEAVGYTAVPGRADPGRDRIDLSDADTVATWDGLFDNPCDFDVDGIRGHGYVEVGLGVHARYRPEEGS